MTIGTRRLKDKKITILDVFIETDEIGNQNEVIRPIPGGENIWAYYRQASADEFFGAASVNYKVEAIFEINWRRDINPRMKILYKGEVYEITRIDDFEGYKKDLRIYAYKIN